VTGDARSIECLYTDIEWALAQGLPPRDLVPMLQRLVRAAEPSSAYAVYGKRQLAEYIVRRAPFRAARLAQEVLAVEDDDRAYAVLGMAHLLLGNYRSAEKAYRSALRLMPHCPWYAHNLGHLLDVGRGQPQAALPFLRLARRLLPQEPEIASSLAHALLKTGAPDEAYPHLLEAVRGDEVRAKELFEKWRAPARTAAESTSDSAARRGRG
jgi:Flp pilus assembly protein TadD